MRRGVLALLIACAPMPALAGSLEADVLAEVNRARADPAAYAAALHDYRTFYHGRMVAAPGARELVETQEGVRPVDEAITVLTTTRRRAALAASPLLSEGAADLATDQAHTGGDGHYTRDGSDPGMRVRRRGGHTYVAEVITYGAHTAADVVRDLIVDDGVPDRGHRTELFSSEWRYAGVSCGPHPVYRTMCVIDLASTRDGAQPMQTASLDRR